MYSFKQILFAKYSLFLAIILGILGVQTSCRPSEYGSPTATYKVSGNIKSDSTGNSIPGIKITMFSNAVYSDPSGSYSIDVTTEVFDQFSIRFSDVDDTLHGRFQDKDTLVDFQNATYANGDGHWYEGETSKVVNIKLKPKN